MLCSIYIEALLVNEDLADRVWQAWNAGEICDMAAASAWLRMLRLPSSTD
ncbi:MAG: hypothetical protein IH838_13990 [Proteobacteria bacterium]|nr:hypothetical protein [Pseudomonadota bacterium]